MAHKIKYLTNDEVRELFDQIRRDNTAFCLRNMAIFQIAKYCALRVSEVGMILVDDYNPYKHEIYCRREKGSNNNTIRIIDEDVRKALVAHWAAMKEQKSKYLFLSQRNTPISRKTLDGIMKKYCVGTSIPQDKRHFHVLKHTRAVELGNAGLHVRQIQWWLGHTNVQNTEIYAQFTTTQQEALYRKLQASGGFKTAIKSNAEIYMKDETGELIPADQHFTELINFIHELAYDLKNAVDQLERENSKEK